MPTLAPTVQPNTNPSAGTQDAPMVAPTGGPEHSAGWPSSLWAVLAFTFLNSIGSAIIYSGIFFLAEFRYGFTKIENYGLATLYGAAYIPAAVLVGPGLRALGRSRLRLTPRGLLVFIMVAMGLLCFVPGVIALAEPAGVTETDRSGWPIWLLVGVYSPLSGALWPLVESYMSGGRSGADLRSVTGKFNVAWSGALVVTLLSISALVKERPIEVLTVLGVVHLLCVLNLRWFTPAPAAHIVEHHEPPPPAYAGLLAMMRVLLPVAFLVLAALAPSLPAARERLGLGPAWGTTLAAGWMIARVGAFFVMERWHGWHGRWSVPLAGGGLLLGAFAVLIFAPMLLSGAAAVAVFFAGLLAFGVGVGVVYCAALYYALEVGQAEVDAGGTHETLIGIGYTVGPLCGLVACGLASRGSIEGENVETVMLALVSALALAGAGLAVYLARRAARLVAR